MNVGVSCNFMDTVVYSDHITIGDVVPLCYIVRGYTLIMADVVANL